MTGISCSGLMVEVLVLLWVGGVLLLVFWLLFFLKFAVLFIYFLL